MRVLAATLVFFATAGLAVAEERRSEAAHVHGVSRLDMAVEGNSIELALTAPAADIIGFEHEARSPEEKKKLAAAIQTLKSPLAIFTPNAEAGCALAKATIGEQLHEEHAEHEHGHHEEHSHQEEHAHHGDHHAEHAHKDHGHKDHDHKEHDHHAHEEHAEESHSDFSAQYAFECAAPGKLRSIAFPYFKAFPNAEKIDIRLITKKGQFAYSVSRAAPALDISGAL